jgi:hypothetical protein
MATEMPLATVGSSGRPPEPDKSQHGAEAGEGLYLRQARKKDKCGINGGKDSTRREAYITASA